MALCGRFSWGSDVREESGCSVSAGGTGADGLGTCATPVAHGLDGSSGWPLEVEAGHELPVGEPGGVEFVGALAELDANVSHLGREGGDPSVELVDILGCTEPGGLPGLLAHEFGEAAFKLLDAGGVAGTASLGGVEVGLQRRMAHCPGIGVRGLGGEAWMWSSRSR